MASEDQAAANVREQTYRASTSFRYKELEVLDRLFAMAQYGAGPGDLASLRSSPEYTRVWKKILRMKAKVERCRSSGT